MITIKDTYFTSNVNLATMLIVRAKEYMLDTCMEPDLYVSQNNMKKEETAHRIPRISTILFRVCSLNKSELQLVDKFVKTG